MMLAKSEGNSYNLNKLRKTPVRICIKNYFKHVNNDFFSWAGGGGSYLCASKEFEQLK